MSDEEKGFVIKDRRAYTSEGEEREPATGSEARPEPEGTTEEAGTTMNADMKGDPGQEADQQQALPEVNFASFVFSLGTSSLMHMGEIPDPNTGRECKNMPLAKQTIDILGMLKEKTKGNLDSEEENLLSNMLYELRMKYVTAVKG